MQQHLLNVLERMPRAWVRTSGVLLVLTIGLLDLLTGYEVTLSIFYLLPIMLVAWSGDRVFAVGTAFLAAMTWLGADILSGHSFSNAAIAVWNTLVVLGFFLLVALVLDSIKASLIREQLLARTDHLTGALNSRAFTDAAELEIERAARYGRPFTLVFLDVDNFKQVNDNLGHSTGDRLLRAVADVMREHVRSTDLVARLGGDEFALLMPETDERSARTALGNIHKLLQEKVRQNSWPVTFSMGAVTCGHRVGVDELLHRADTLMYAAKAGGKDRSEFSTWSGISDPIGADTRTNTGPLPPPRR